MIATDDETWKDKIHTRVATIDAAESNEHEKQLSSQYTCWECGDTRGAKSFQRCIVLNK